MTTPTATSAQPPPLPAPPERGAVGAGNAAAVVDAGRVVVDDATEDAGAQESAAFKVVDGGGLLVGAGW